jgi:hypothetical protein
MATGEKMRAIVEALVALRDAVQVSCNVSIDRMGVSFQAYEDSGVVALAGAFGLTVGEKRSMRDPVHWLDAGGFIGDVRVSVFGPHHPDVAPIDEQRLDSAVDQAQAALAGASS